MLRVEDFPAFCFVELPLFINYNVFNWNASAASLFVDSLRQRMGTDYGPMSFRPEHFAMRKKLYMYRGDRKLPTVLLVFRTLDAMRRTASVLNYPFRIDGLGEVKVNVWEDNVKPIRKFLSKCGITHTSWLHCQGELVDEDDKISKLKNEYRIQWTSIAEIPKELTKKWQTRPGIMGFDIETYSNRHKMFPNKFNADHVAYMISCIYQRVGSKERTRYGIILGDCNEIPEDQFANTTLFKVNTEEELVRMMGALIQYHDVEIITGWNIMGYDFDYLDVRLSRTGNTWPDMSRLKKRRCYVESDSWTSKGQGYNKSYKLRCPGRVSIDGMLVIKREGFRYPSFSLNYVSKTLIDDEKHDITAQQMFVRYEKMLDGVKLGGETYKDAMTDITEVMLYCIQDSELVMKVLDNIHWWISTNEMSAITGLSIGNLPVSGQTAKCASQLYNIAVNNGFIMDYRPSPDIPFEGGAVQPPTPGLHPNVLVIDFASLYPSIIRRFNICWTTVIPQDMYGKIPEEWCNSITINCNSEHDPEEDIDDEDEDEKAERTTVKGRKGVYVFKFIKEEILQGLLPRLVGKLIDDRATVRAELEKTTDELDKIVLDKRQNALKINANSFFGILGARDGTNCSY